MPGNYRYEEERSRGQRSSTRRSGFGERGRDDDDIEQYEGERYGGRQHGREVGGGSERYQGGGFEGRESGARGYEGRGAGGGRDYERSLGTRGDEGFDEEEYGSTGGREGTRYGAGRWGSQGSQRGYGGGEYGGAQGYGGQYRGAQGFGGSQGAWQGGRSMQGEGWTGQPDETRWSRQQGLYGSSEYGGYMSSQRAQSEFQSNVGKGPKGWRRSDERIREEVSEALARHPEIDASDVEVRVQNGEVTLSGSVTDRRAKRLAEDVAEGVFGANDVQNQIKVNASATQTSQQSRSGERDVTGSAEREGRTGAEGRTTTEGQESRRTGAGAGSTTR